MNGHLAAASGAGGTGGARERSLRNPPAVARNSTRQPVHRFRRSTLARHRT